MRVEYKVGTGGKAGWILARHEDGSPAATWEFASQEAALAEQKRREGVNQFGLESFDVDVGKRTVRHAATGASVAFYPCSEEDWRANPGDFAIQPNFGSLEPQDKARFEAGALAAAKASDMGGG
jgi:hypothetical protein